MKTNTDLQTELTTLITDPLNGQNTALDVRTIISDVIDSTVATISTITVQGTTDATTAYMNFGINLVAVSTNSDFCARLANPPVEGGVVNIINTSLLAITIFPSQIGGSINGVVDGSFIVPNDNKSYIFTCYENPLPGAWTVTAPATTQIVLGEMSVAHTQGVASSVFGAGTNNAIGAMGASLDGSGNIVLATPSAWGHLTTFATCTKTKIYTNIVAGDVVNNLTGVIKAERIVFFKSSANGATSLVANDYLEFEYSAGTSVYGFTVYEAPVGTLTPSPNELVGDTGTYYVGHHAPSALVGNNLGIPCPACIGAFSGYYWHYAIHIGAAAITKTYKFQIFLEYF